MFTLSSEYKLCFDNGIVKMLYSDDKIVNILYSADQIVTILKHEFILIILHILFLFEF